MGGGGGARSPKGGILASEIGCNNAREPQKSSKEKEILCSGTTTRQDECAGTSKAHLANSMLLAVESKTTKLLNNVLHLAFCKKKSRDLCYIYLFSVAISQSNKGLKRLKSVFCCAHECIPNH